MFIHRHKLFTSFVSAVLVLAFGLSSSSFAFESSEISTLAPQLTLSKKDDVTKKEWLFADICMLIAAALKQNTSESSLRSRITSHVKRLDGTKQLEEEGYDIGGIKETVKGSGKDRTVESFLLPVNRPDKKLFLEYRLDTLKDESPALTIPASGFTLYIYARHADELSGIVVTPETPQPKTRRSASGKEDAETVNRTCKVILEKLGQGERNALIALAKEWGLKDEGQKYLAKALTVINRITGEDYNLATVKQADLWPVLCAMLLPKQRSVSMPPSPQQASVQQIEPVRLVRGDEETIAPAMIDEIARTILSKISAADRASLYKYDKARAEKKDVSGLVASMKEAHANMLGTLELELWHRNIDMKYTDEVSRRVREINLAEPEKKKGWFGFRRSASGALLDDWRKAVAKIDVDFAIDPSENMSEEALKAVEELGAEQSATAVVFHETKDFYYLLSAAHVVSPDSLPLEITNPRINITLSNGARAKADILGYGYGWIPDICLMKIGKDGIDRDAVRIIPLGNEDLIREAVNKEARILGHFGKRTPEVVGTIIGHGHTYGEDSIMLDTYVEDGFSGGPVVFQGKIIGIISLMQEEKLTVAVSAAAILGMLESLTKGNLINVSNLATESDIAAISDMLQAADTGATPEGDTLRDSASGMAPNEPSPEATLLTRLVQAWAKQNGVSGISRVWETDDSIFLFSANESIGFVSYGPTPGNKDTLTIYYETIANEYRGKGLIAILQMYLFYTKRIDRVIYDHYNEYSLSFARRLEARGTLLDVKEHKKQGTKNIHARVNHEEVKKVINGLLSITGAIPEKDIPRTSASGMVPNEPSPEIDASGKMEIRQKYGGKALWLLRLVDIAKGLDFKVPEFELIATDIFDNFLLDNDITRKGIDHLYADDINYERVAGKIRKIFEEADFNDGSIVLIRQIFERMREKEKPIVIRSSSVLEDNDENQFKGIYDSEFLIFTEDVERDFAQFISLIKSVYSSIFMPTARSYRIGNDIPDIDRMGIIVQQIVGKEHDYERYYPPLSGVTLFDPYSPATTFSYMNRGLNTKTVRGEYMWKFAYTPDHKERLHQSYAVPTVESVEGQVSTDYDYLGCWDNGELVENYSDFQGTDYPQYFVEYKRDKAEFLKRYKENDFWEVYSLRMDKIAREIHKKFGPIEIEWSVDDDGEINIYQCRPSYTFKEPTLKDKTFEDIPADLVLTESNVVMGNGRIEAPIIISPKLYLVDIGRNRLRKREYQDYILVTDFKNMIKNLAIFPTAEFINYSLPGMIGLIDISGEPVPLAAHWSEPLVKNNILIISSNEINQKLREQITDSIVAGLMFSKEPVVMEVDAASHKGRVYSKPVDRASRQSTKPPSRESASGMAANEPSPEASNVKQTTGEYRSYSELLKELSDLGYSVQEEISERRSVGDVITYKVYKSGDEIGIIILSHGKYPGAPILIDGMAPHLPSGKGYGEALLAYLLTKGDSWKGLTFRCYPAQPSLNNMFDRMRVPFNIVTQAEGKIIRIDGVIPPAAEIGLNALKLQNFLIQNNTHQSNFLNTEPGAHLTDTSNESQSKPRRASASGQTEGGERVSPWGTSLKVHASGIEPAVEEVERIQVERFRDAIKRLEDAEKDAPLTVVVDTSWIKGYVRGNDQHTALNPLITKLKRYCEERGITFESALGKEVSPLIVAGRAKGEGAKVVVLADQKTILDELEAFESDKNIFMVGVDNSNLNERSYMRVVEMLRLALELSLLKDIIAESENIIIDTKSWRFPVLIPKAEPIQYDYERLRAMYLTQISA